MNAAKMTTADVIDMLEDDNRIISQLLRERTEAKLAMDQIKERLAAVENQKAEHIRSAVEAGKLKCGVAYRVGRFVYVAEPKDDKNGYFLRVYPIEGVEP